MSEDRKPMKRVGGVYSEKDQPWWVRAKRIIFAESPEDVKKSIIKDVIEPYIRNFIFDFFVGTIERSIFGSDTSRIGNGYYSYSSRYNTASRSAPVRQPVQASYNNYAGNVSNIRSTLYDPVIMVSRAKCIEELNILRERIGECGSVTVNELNESLVDENNNSRIGKFTDAYYGWKSLEGAYAREIGGGAWELVLPEPIQLEQIERR